MDTSTVLSTQRPNSCLIRSKLHWDKCLWIHRDAQSVRSRACVLKGKFDLITVCIKGLIPAEQLRYRDVSAITPWCFFFCFFCTCFLYKRSVLFLFSWQVHRSKPLLQVLFTICLFAIHYVYIVNNQLLEESADWKRVRRTFLQELLQRKSVKYAINWHLLHQMRRRR